MVAKLRRGLAGVEEVWPDVPEVILRPASLSSEAAGTSEAKERERWHQQPPELCPPPVNRDRSGDVPQGYAIWRP